MEVEAASSFVEREREREQYICEINMLEHQIKYLFSKRYTTVQYSLKAKGIVASATLAFIYRVVVFDTEGVFVFIFYFITIVLC